MPTVLVEAPASTRRACDQAVAESRDRPCRFAAQLVLFAPSVMVRPTLLPAWCAVFLLGHGLTAIAVDHPRVAWTPYRTPTVSSSLGVQTPVFEASASGVPAGYTAAPGAPIAPLASPTQVACLPTDLPTNVACLATDPGPVVGVPALPFDPNGPLAPPAYVEGLPGSEVHVGVGRGRVDPGQLAWHSRILPEGLVWRSYLAGVHEPRFSGIVFADHDGTPMLDVALGGRMAVWRYGTDEPLAPQGYELQIEGAALPRLNLDQFWDLEAVDFRFGVPLVWSNGRWQWKAGYYHLSAHLGDELAAREGVLAGRINYARDVLLAGVSFFPLPAWRWYAEAGWAFYTDGGAEPWELQFGVDIVSPGPTGLGGVPFAAFNGHLREENDFGGSLTAQAGWLWRGNSGRMLRTGVHYYNGKSSQYQFFNFFEEQIGVGLWGEF